MGMVQAALAAQILTALGSPTDKNGAPIGVTAEMLAYANAVITTHHGAKFSHATGTVTGSAPPGGALAAGTALNGVIANLLSATWAGILAAGFPGATTTAAEAAASTGYISANGKINFSSGKITGSSTATGGSPGILSNGAGANGLEQSLVGSAWAAAVLAALGTPGPLASAVYTAVAAYIAAHAVCSYASGSVTGTFSAGGGALAAGKGINGAIA